jgi:hypothetical protein
MMEHPWQSLIVGKAKAMGYGSGEERGFAHPNCHPNALARASVPISYLSKFFAILW